MFGLTADEWRDLVLSVNVHRKNRRLAPFDAAGLIRKATLSADPSVVAEALGFTDLTTFNKILRLADLPPDLASLVEWGSRRGSLSMSTATELLRLPQDQQAPAIRLAVENNLTKEEARQVAQVNQRTGLPADQCVAQALKTRVKVERSELILGSIVSDRARAIIQSLGPEQATTKLKRRLAAQFPDVVTQAFSLRGNRFSLLLSEADGGRLRQALGGQSVEQTLTRMVESLHGN